MRNLFILLLLYPLAIFAQNLPEPMNPPQLVNDFAGAFNKQEQGLLENKLRNYRDTTSTEISVVAIRSTGGYDISQYGALLAEKWGIGTAGNDNGLLMLIALDDRRISISTGYGLEGAITDAQSRRVIDQYITPNFKSKNYFRGVDQATSILMSMANGEYEALPKEKTYGRHFLGLIFILFIINILSRFRRFRNRHYGSSAPSLLTTLWMLGGLSSHNGRGFDSFSKGGGVFGGGSSFGGFGGGSFGGGGASGSW